MNTILNVYCKITIVTPCFNMAPYIEQTILSVLNQNYPDLEYIIIDGGSTDGTQEIISKYVSRLSYYVSEPDNGMYDAIAKGFSHATGDVLAWINADDIYMPDTFAIVNRVFSQHKDVDWIGGRYSFLSENGNEIKSYPKCSSRCQKDIAEGWCREDVLGFLQQESMFWRRNLYIQSGGMNASYRFAGDFELWTRFALHSSLAKVDMPLASFRLRKMSLSNAGKDKYQEEVNRVISDKQAFPSLVWRVFHGSPLMIQLLRMLRFRKMTFFTFSSIDHPVRSQSLKSASNHTLCSLLSFKFPK